MTSSTCIQVKTSIIGERIKVYTNILYGFGLNSFPLFVDEGFLLIDLNGKTSKLFVQKK